MDMSGLLKKYIQIIYGKVTINKIIICEGRNVFFLKTYISAVCTENNNFDQNSHFLIATLTILRIKAEYSGTHFDAF